LLIPPRESWASPEMGLCSAGTIACDEDVTARS